MGRWLRGCSAAEHLERATTSGGGTGGGGDSSQALTDVLVDSLIRRISGVASGDGALEEDASGRVCVAREALW